MQSGVVRVRAHLCGDHLGYLQLEAWQHLWVLPR